jgi:hypothetical protein
MPIKRAQYTTQSNKGYSGKTTKLSISQFVHYLFDINESSPPDGKKLRDEDIIESVRSEFGTKPITVRKIADPNSNSSLSAQRARYNKTRPSLLSIRYDGNEHPCRNYNSNIDIDDLRVKAWRYGIVDPRLFTVDEIKAVLIHQQDNPRKTERFVLPTRDLIKDHPYGSIKFSSSVGHLPRTRIDTDTLELIRADS